jgi:histone H3/H4
LLHEFIEQREQEFFVKIAEIVRMSQRKTIFLSDVVKGAKLLNFHIDATNAIKEKSMKGKKPKTEKRRATGLAAASEVRRLQKSSGLLIAYTKFEGHVRSWFNNYLSAYLGVGGTIHINPAALRVMQLYVERRVLDLLTVAAILLLRDGLKAHKTLGARHLDTAIINYNFLVLGLRPNSIGVWGGSN